MKENTQIEDSVKALFFAQYLGQKVLVHKLVGHEPAILTKMQLDAFHGQLLLRSIDQLTNEELLSTSDLCGWIRSKNEELNIETGRDCIEEFLQDYHLSIMAYQYLLRIGILIQFTYLDKNNQPVTLQPSDLIELGWAKYQQS